MLFSQTLGTALGDWLADDTGLGYECGALVFAAGLAVVVGASLFTKLVAHAVLGSVHSQASSRCDGWRSSGQATPKLFHLRAFVLAVAAQSRLQSRR
jgi:hypothetical protein